MDFSSPEKALHFIIPFFCGIFNKKAIGIRKNKKISTQKAVPKIRPAQRQPAAAVSKPKCFVNVLSCDCPPVLFPKVYHILTRG